MQDLFETPELLPKEVQSILRHFNAIENEKGVQYSDLIKLGQELAVYGFEFDFYLDCVPYNLRKVTKKLNFMNYDQYLFSQLLALFDFDYAEMPYDYQYAEALSRYEQFDKSEFNDENLGIYECIVNYLKNQYKPVKSDKYARKCTCCGKGMNEGYFATYEYFCSDSCLRSEFSATEWEELVNENNDNYYWTEWEDLEDYQYQIINGILEEIN